MSIFEPHNLPFAAALLLMLLLAFVQALGLFDAFDTDAGVDLDADASTDVGGEGTI